MRRAHLRGHQNILKRVLIYTAGCNVSLLMRKLFGVGTPRALQGLAALVESALNWALQERARAEDEQSRADIKAGEAEAAQQAEADARRRADEKAEEAAKSLRTIKHNSYTANVQMAGAWLGLRDSAHLRERLDACPSDLRGWEWHWLDAAADNSLVVMYGHTSEVWSALFSSNGLRLVTSSADGTTRVWDTTTGETIAEIVTQTSWRAPPSISPDGERVLTASRDGIARMWDATTGVLLADLVGSTEPVESVAFSPNGTRLVTTSGDGIARVWDGMTGTLIAKLNKSTDIRGSTLYRSFADFSPDGTRIIRASRNDGAGIWQADTGELVAVLKVTPRREYERYEGLPSDRATFSPDGTRVAVASHVGTVFIWLTATCEQVAELVGHTGAITSATFSPDGTKIVTASDDMTARVWDTATGDSIMELKGHAGSVNSASFGPDGLRIVTASDDGTARVWNAITGVCLDELQGHLQSVLSASFNPDGSRVLTASEDGTARIWDAEWGGPFSSFGERVGRVSGAVFSPDSTRIVATRSYLGSTYVLDALTGELVAELSGRSGEAAYASFSPDSTRILTVPLLSNGPDSLVWNAATGELLVRLLGRESSIVSSAAFSPDGTRILTATLNGTFVRNGNTLSFRRSDDAPARVWDAATGEPLAELKGHTGEIGTAAFNFDGTRVVTASYDGTARVWDAATGDSLIELNDHTDWVLSASFSPDGLHVLTASRDGAARLWDAANGDLDGVCRGGRSVTCASFSPDGSRFAMHGEQIQIRDADSCRCLVELGAGADLVTSISWSPDGTRLVTASLDGRVILWDVDTGDVVAELGRFAGAANSASFSQDGTRIVAIADDGTIRLWDKVPHRVRFMQWVSRGAKGESAGRVVDRRVGQMESWTRMASSIREDPELTSETQRRALGIVAVRAEIERRPLAYARRLLRARQWDQACATYTDLIKEQPNSADVAFEYAYCLHMSGDVAAAIKAYRYAATFTEVRGVSLYNLGCAYAQTGDVENALDAIEASLQADADIADSLETDDDLDSIRLEPRFQELVREALSRNLDS